jgi:hypothetical protein
MLARYDEACVLVGPEMVMVQELVPGRGETRFHMRLFAKIFVWDDPLPGLLELPSLAALLGKRSLGKVL